MSDKDAKYPQNSVMQHPDGSKYVYVKAAEDLTRGTYIEPNPVGLVLRFKGGLRFPAGIVMETVPEDYWTWVMVQPGQVRQPESNLVLPK